MIVKWVDGQYVHVETATDISQRIEYEQQLHYYASTDIMTGIYKREWGRRLLAEKYDDPNCSGSICFLDIDGLKKTNDTYGHAAGDELLMESVKIMRKFIAEEEFICRWGGDEFLLWLAVAPEQAHQRLHNMQQDMQVYNREHDKKYQLAFSYGIVPLQHGTDITLDSLITAADEMMYRNKMAKRGLQRRRDDCAHTNMTEKQP